MSLFTLIASSKLAASAVALGTLAVGGVGTAAYTGALPEPVQQAAHELIGAPAPSVEDIVSAAPELPTAAPSASPSAAAEAKASAAPVGPDALGLEAAALCKAFGAGGLDVSSVAYRNLSAAAQGEANIGAYCEVAGTSAGVGAEAGVDAQAEVGASLPDAAKALPSLPAEAAVPTAPALPSAPAVDAQNLPSTDLR
ncbi:hypothetical protein [Sinomonas mesophila]|uniref:hypothetical protein n=1 Tax=Sinomonas mesophila TaxID=1531955 RepID=UPI00098760A7|nr:hypothetical protein [Sinomonas mesophila]